MRTRSCDYLFPRLVAWVTNCLVVLPLVFVAGCGGGPGGLGVGAGVVGFFAHLFGSGAALTVPLVIFPGEQDTKPAALLPFTAEVRALAITPDDNKLYAADTLHNAVSVIDARTRRVIKIIDVGTGPRFIAVSPDGRKALVANFGTFFDADNTVVVIDTASDQVVATITVGKRPFAIAITPDSRRAYVANSADNTISVIDLSANTVTTIDAAANYTGVEPVAIVITSDGKRAFVANRGSNNLSMLDLQSNQVLRTEPVGVKPTGLALHPDDTFVYVTNRDSDSVSVIAVATGAVQKTLAVGVGPMAAVVSPDGKRVYVAGAFSGAEDDLCGESTKVRNTVSVIDALSNTVVPGEITVGAAPLAVVIADDNAKMYTVSSCEDVATQQGTVSVLETKLITGQGDLSAKNIVTPARGTAAVLSSNGRLYVAHPHLVSVIDVASDSVVGAPIAVRGIGPIKLALSANDTKLYAIRPGGNTVAVMDVNLSTGLLQLVGTVNVGNEPSDLRITRRPVGDNQVYVANAGHSRSPDSRVSVIDVTPAGSVDSTIDQIKLEDLGRFPPVGRGPLSLAFDANYSQLFVANFGDFFSNDRNSGKLVSKIDLQTKAVTNFDTYGQWPTAVAVDADSLYTVSFFDNQIQRGQASSPSIRRGSAFAGDIDHPMGIALANSRAYTANYRTSHVGTQDRTVVVEIEIDLNNIAKIATQTVPGLNPGRIVVSPDEKVAYVLHTGDRAFRCGTAKEYFCATGNSLSAITLPFTATPLTATLTVGSHPSDIAFTPSLVNIPKRALVSNYYDGTVSVIEPWTLNATTTPAVVNTLQVGAGPMGIVVNAAGTRAYVANSISNTISIIALDGLTPGAVLGTASLEP